MAQPTAYNRLTSFSNYQAQNPAEPLSGASLDAELNAVRLTLSEILDNLALVQRDDGALANESVGLDQLSPEIEVGWQAPEVWVTATAYVVGNTVFHGSGFYRVLEDHTAGTFATDLAADKLELIVDLSTLTLASASGIAVTPTGGIAATNVQAALAELDSEKAALSHTHPSSAISDGTAAGRTLLTAANAAAQRTALGLGALALADTVPVTNITAEVALSGIIEPAALASDTNDWAPTGIATCSTIRMSSSAAISLTGILAPAVDGTILVLENVSDTYAITLSPSSASSAAANRFLIPKPIIVGPNSSVVLKYDKDASVPRWRLFDRASHLPKGYLNGLTLSNNGSDATNDIDVAAGEARGMRGILDLVLPSALTGKRLDADWAAGSSAGVRYSGAAIANGTYWYYLIGKADGTTDVFAYTGTDPTSVLPSGYIDYACLGAVLRESAAIVPFIQYEDQFDRVTSVLDVSAANPGSSAVTRTLSVPTGRTVRARVRISPLQNSAANSPLCLVSALDVTDETPAEGNAQTGGSYSGVSNAAEIEVRTNASGQVRSRMSFSDGNTTLKIRTTGWIYRRNR